MILTQEYEFQYPPDQSLCLKHRLATRIWKGFDKENQNDQVCYCCGRKVGEQIVESQFCYDTEELAFLGVGIPLFFSFLRYSILLLFILLLIFCIFGLYSNISSNNCKNDADCKLSIFNTFSLINKKQQDSYMLVQNYILLTFVVLTIFIFQFFRYRFRKIVQNIDFCYVSPSDYSVILKRLPQGTTEQDIQFFLQHRRGFLDQQQKQQTNNLQVQKIVVSYDLTEYNQKKQQCLEQFKQAIKAGKADSYRKPTIAKPTVPGFIAIIQFSKQQSKQLLIEEPSLIQRLLYQSVSTCSPLSDNFINGERFCIERAPEPDDILWSNSNITVNQGVCRKLILGSISFILLLAGGAAQYGLALWQKKIENQSYSLIVSAISSTVVVLTNLILQNFLILTTSWQRMNTVTQLSDVMNFKLVFQQFLNAGIFLVGANILANVEKFNLQNSLSQTITIVMILNALMRNANNILVYRTDIMGRIMRYFCLKKGCSIYTQLQANHLYALPLPILPQKYSYIIKTIWLTAFYAPFVPIVVVISIIGLILDYIIQKYLFGQYYSAPNMIYTNLNNTCIEMFQYVPLILSFGSFVIYFYFKEFNFNNIPIHWSIAIYLSIGISLFNLIVPMKDINKCLFPMKLDLSEQPTYKQAEKEFEVTYEMTNPIYQSKRLRITDGFIWKKLFGHLPQIPVTSNKQTQNQTKAPGLSRRQTAVYGGSNNLIGDINTVQSLDANYQIPNHVDQIGQYISQYIGQYIGQQGKQSPNHNYAQEPTDQQPYQAPQMSNRPINPLFALLAPNQNKNL